MNRRPVVNATPAGFLNIGGFNLAIALLYIAAGGLGLQLAVPPGYATIIWPASGIAIAGLLLYGERLTPGIFLGPFILNCFVGGVFSAAEFDPKAIVVAAMIASGSTIQALLALFLVRRFFGIPVRMSGFPHIVLFVLVCGPLSCLLAPSIGVFALYAAGLVSYDLLAANWLTWWAGDMLGVLVFLPISLFNPWRTWSIEWSGRPVAGFTVVTLLCLIIPLATTFYAWKYTSAVTFQKNQAAFEAMMEDNQHNLIDRLDSYRQALDGGAGLFHASGHVTRNDWRTYVETLDITRKLPGINGIGFIEPVEKDMLDIYPDLIRADGVPNLVIHPKDAAFGNFIIKYIEPIGPNRAAVGLDIGFEQNRYKAAIHARDTGEPTITKRIFLVQDKEKTLGFLLLRPIYEVGHPVNSVEDRKKSFHGWIYAPFIASRFMDGLTASQAPASTSPFMTALPPIPASSSIRAKRQVAIRDAVARSMSKNRFPSWSSNGLSCGTARAPSRPVRRAPNRFSFLSAGWR
jgi:CHASE domain/MASE1